jgi:hypothetical protein
MSMLFEVTSGNTTPLATVHAVESPGIAGVYDPVSGKICVPDPDAIRQALPHQWRAAWDRQKLGFWYREQNSMAHKELYRSTGERLATIWVRAYYLEPADTGMVRTPWADMCRVYEG